jgi:hypothetical protein
VQSARLSVRDESHSMSKEARVKPERARLFPKLDPARWYPIRRHEGLDIYIWDGTRELLVIAHHFDVREPDNERNLTDF